MYRTASQTFLPEFDMNGAERNGRPSNVAPRIRAGARINLKNVLNNYHTQLQIDPANLAGLAPAQPPGGAGLIDLVATIPFQHAFTRWQYRRHQTSN